MNRFGLVHRNIFYGRNTVEQEQCTPIYAGKVGQQLAIAHFVVVFLHVALFCGTVRGSGNARFDVHHRFHALLGLGGTFSCHSKQMPHIQAISFANVAGGFIVAQVIVALTHGDASLVNLHQVPLGVFFISFAPQAEKAINAT